MTSSRSGSGSNLQTTSTRKRWWNGRSSSSTLSGCGALSYPRVRHYADPAYPSVLNTFKTMVTDDDLLEKDDSYVLDRMKVFVSNAEVSNFAAAKQLLILIERAVRRLSLLSLNLHLNKQCSNGEVMPQSRQPIPYRSPHRHPLFPGRRKSSSCWTLIPPSWPDNLHSWKLFSTRRFDPWSVYRGLGNRKRGRPVIISRRSSSSVTG